MINFKEINERIEMFFSGLIQGFVITLIILSLIFAIFYPRSSRSLNVQALREKYCVDLVISPNGCNKVLTDSILIKDFDANKDGKIDKKDTLQALCENYFGIVKGNQTDCRKFCGCTPSNEELCEHSGGTAKIQLCCNSVSDFPNTCQVGVCVCSPNNSHDVKICDCGEGKCWDKYQGKCI
jgi:hypothetical protein